MAKMYCQWAGIVLIVLGVIGFFTHSLLGVNVEGLHNWIHLLSGVILAYLGFFAPTSAKMGAQVFGVVYTLVAVVGFIQGNTVLGLISTSGVYNIIHLVVGVLALYAGFGKSAEMAKA